MDVMAVRLVLKVPITWMSGYYKLENAKVFHFIPAGGAGNFNVDLKLVTIEVVTTVKTTYESLDEPKAKTNIGDPKPTIPLPTTISTFNPSNISQTILSSKFSPNKTVDKEVEKSVCLDVFNVGIHWQKASFKFDGLWKGFGHLTDFSLNQVILSLFH